MHPKVQITSHTESQNAQNSELSSSSNNSCLEFAKEESVNSVSGIVTDSTKDDEDTSEPKTLIYVAILDYEPTSSEKDSIALKEGQEVELIEKAKPHKWIVRTRPTAEFPEIKQGIVPSCYLEKKRSTFQTSALVEEVIKEVTADPRAEEAKAKREAVVKELVETEEDFSRDMQHVVNTYVKEMENPAMPKELRDQKEVVFGNFEAICEFHNKVLIQGVKYNASEPAKLGTTFLRLERDFDKHATYCRDEPKAQELISSGSMKEYFEAYSKKIGDDKTLSEHLKLPIQRINDYQLLMKELLKYTARLNEDTTDLQKALELMQSIPQRAADLTYINSIEGYRGNLLKLGRILKRDWFEVTDAQKKTVERYAYLFRGRLFLTEVTDITPEKKKYILRKIIKLHEVEMKESSEDDRTIIFHHKDSKQTDFPIYFKAKTSEQKKEWMDDLHISAQPPGLEDLGDEEPEVISEVEGKPEKVAEEPVVVNGLDALEGAPEPQVTSPLVEEPEEGYKSQTSVEEIKEDKIEKEKPKVEVLEDFEAYEEMNTVVTESLRSGSITSLDDFQSLVDSGPEDDDTYVTASEAEGEPTPSIKPEFKEPLKEITATVGDKVVFECEVLANPPATITWQKDNTSIPYIQRPNPENQLKHSLTIREVRLQDSGIYTVVATNPVGSCSSSAALTVMPAFSLEVPKEDSRPTTPGGTLLPQAPIFKVKLKDTELLEGTCVRFEIIARAHPPPELTFYKDDQELKQDDRVRVLFESKEVCELLIDHVTPEDGGTYSCVAVNSEGKAVTSAEVVVTKDKVLFQGLEEEGAEPQRTDSALSTDSRGKSPIFKWFKDGQEFEASERFQVTFSDEDDSLALVFQHVTPDDAGLYTCVANTMGGKIACSAELTVQGSVHHLLKDPEPASIKVNLSDVEVNEGGSAMLELKASGYPPPKITWSHDGQVVEPNDRVKFLFEDVESFTMVIKNVKKEDAGEYKVVASNDLGEASTSCKLTVTAAPKFTKELKDKKVKMDEKIRLEVDVEGCPAPEVKWYKDGQQVTESKRVKIIHDTATSYVLVIEKARAEDAGSYSCVAKNSVGSQTTSGAVVVTVPPSFVSGLKDAEAADGETVSFDIKIAGNPKPTVTWMKDGAELKIDGTHVKVVEEDSTTFKLVIEKITTEDVATYSCKITNDLGSQESKGKLQVKSKPVFKKKLEDREAKDGDTNVEFTVKIEGTPKPTVKWFHDEKDITVNNRYQTEEASGSYTLRIPTVATDLGGKYTCEATNSAGKASSSAVFTVNSAPKFTQGLKDTEITEDQNVSFTVKIDGFPKPEVKWMKDSAELTIDGKRIKTKEEASNTFTLILDKATKDDGGQYSCKISNSYGEQTSSCKLTVKIKGTGPTFKQGLKDVETSEGETVSFTVKIAGIPKPSIKWTKDSAELTIDGKRIKTVEEASDSYTLILNQVSTKDVGTYACEIRNEFGSDKTEGKLKVKSAPVDDGQKPSFVKKLKDTMAVIGDAVRLEVKIAGKPKPEVTWMKDGEQLTADKRIRITVEDDVYAITIKDLTANDGGRYACLAKNEKGEATDQAAVTVKEPGAPYVEGMTDIEVTLDEVGKFEVTVSGFPFPNVEWFRNDTPVLPSDIIVLSTDQDSGIYSLAIRKVREEHEGVYACEASNSAGTSRAEAKLSVKREKPEFLKKLEDQETDLGDVALFETRVKGYPLPKVEWYCNDTLLKTDDYVKITQKGDLHRIELIAVRKEDIGTYTCKATNEVGEAKSTGKLKLPEPEEPKVEKKPQVKPSFGVALKPAELKEGEPAKLEAKVAGQPVPEVKWLKDGKELKPDGHVTIETLPDGTTALRIDNVKPEDAGHYSVVASSPAGETKSEADIKTKPAVVEKPQVKPEFKQLLSPTELTEGKPASLEVKVEGEPKPTIKWTKDGKPLSSDGHFTVEELPDGKAALKIDKVKPDDKGLYAVVASNPAGDMKSQAEIKTKPAPVKPEFTQGLKPTELVVGKPGKLEAVVTGQPAPAVKWLKDGKEITPDGHFEIVELPDGKMVLKIDKVKPGDAGRYAIVVSNPEGESKSEAKVTTIEEGPPKKKPEFSQELKPTDVIEGEPLHLQAKVSGEPKPTIKWMKDGEDLKPSDRIKTRESPDGTVTLDIANATPEDAGKYVVVATNDEGKTRSAAAVDVKAQPKEKPSILEELKPATWNAGEPGKLEAKIDGKPKPTVKWMKDGKEITPSDRIKMIQEPNGYVALVVDKVGPEDAGKYTLVVANENGENRSSAPIAVNQPPMFAVPLKDVDAIEDFPAKLEAKVSGEPTPEISWEKDGKPFKPDGDRVKSITQPDGTAALVFGKCKPDDSGNYTCKAKNPFGEGAFTGALKVAGKDRSGEAQSAPQFIQPISDVDVKEGEPIKLSAIISGNPLPEIKWFLDDQPVLPSDNIHHTFDGKKAGLDIKKSNPQHAGTYECRLVNPLGDTSCKGKVNVQEKSAPVFVQRLADMDGLTSEPLQLSCRVKGFPEPDIQWFYNGDQIFPGLKYNMSKQGDLCTLTLPHPRTKDSGLYECSATNPAGKDRCSAQVKISDKGERGEAPSFLKKLGDVESMEGMTIKFTACITGSPKPDLKWFKDGEELNLTPRHRFEIEPNGLLRLIIRDIQPSDFGEYRLAISNLLGSDQCSAQLRQESWDSKYRPIGDQYAGFDKFRKTGVPVPLSDKPNILRMDDTSLTLGWRPSVPVAPRVPVTYVVEMSKHPDGEWKPYKTGIKDSILDVRGLEPGQDYRFQVRVENKYGRSDPSPYTIAYRSKLVPERPIGEHKPKDYEIEHPPLDKNVAAPRFLRQEEEIMYGVRTHPVSIEFWVYGVPQPTLTWYFNGEKIDMSGKYDFLQDRNGQVVLYITRMTEDDVGTYMCHAMNDHGEARQKIKLQMAEPPVFTQRLVESSVLLRHSVRLECKVIGTPTPKIKWYKDWRPLAESSRISIIWEEPDRCSLFLTDSILKDTGLYSCVAENMAGHASSSAMLTVEENELEYDILTYSRPRVVKPKTKPFEDFYDIGDELGRGTQGITYHAVERATGKSYAAKVMHGKGKLRDFMNAEMDIMNQLSHQRLVRLWDALDTKSSLTLITDLCGGGELLDNILQKTTLTESEVAHYIKQILEGLEYMHGRGIGHLGLTIGDVLVTRLHGDNIKIGDFGLASRLYSGKDHFVEYGHPEYVAPEIANKQPATLASDMWSVGIITYILLSGISPFLGENDRETLKRVQGGKINFLHDAFAEVSEEARDFLSKLLAFDPSFRMDVKAALQHPWLRWADMPGKGDQLACLDNLREYSKRWRSWYDNASCKRWYRRRTLDSCFTHPSKMIYPPGEVYTPPGSPEPSLERTKVKPTHVDEETYQQKINREPIDVRSESQYQNGPDTYLLQLRDTDFPLRIRQYLRVGARTSPTLAANLCSRHWGDTSVAVRERRRFMDVMDEEIDDERKGLDTRSTPYRLQHEIGTLGYVYGQMSQLKEEALGGRKSQEPVLVPFFREKIRDCIIREEDEAVFRCFAIGQPAPTFTWFRNDGILIESSRVVITTSKDGHCELRLKPAKAYDAGVYKCVARNQHGSVVCRARLKMGEVPGRPDTPEVKQCSASEIYLVWSRPRFEGNSDTLCYTLEYKKAEEENWKPICKTVNMEFYVVRNLESGVSYQFRIAARNKFGWGDFSLPTDPTPTLTESETKIKIPKAHKFKQEMLERAGELEIEVEEEIPEIDYSIEHKPIPLEEGQLLEMYNFVSEISRGRFSVVVKAWVKSTTSTGNAKVIISTPETETAVKREYEILKSLRHQNIVTLLSASWGDSLLVLVMERLSGIDVLTYLTDGHQYNEETVAKIIQQVLDALEYLHFRSICYIELQPDNVVMVNNRQPLIKLVDFGSAHYVQKTGSKVVVSGTLEYLAPEVIKKEEVSEGTDIWCVGVLTYILLSGVSPFRGADDNETKDNVTYVRYHFDNLHKEVTQEATRFLMHIFKRTPTKRPTVDECLEHKWLLPNEFMIKKREHAVFLSHRLREFAEEFHVIKQRATPRSLLSKFGMSFSKSLSLETETYVEV